MANFLQNDKEILDVTNDSKYNGRVDILDIKPQQKYKMINQMNNGNRLYKNEAIKSIQKSTVISITHNATVMDNADTIIELESSRIKGVLEKNP